MNTRRAEGVGWVVQQAAGTGGEEARSWPAEIFLWREWPRNLRTQMSNIKLCVVVCAGMRTTCSLYNCQPKDHEQTTNEILLVLMLTLILSLQLNW